MPTSSRLDYLPCSRTVSVTDSNRRVRTRTHGGVAGVGGRPPPLCRSNPLHYVHVHIRERTGCTSAAPRQGRRSRPSHRWWSLAGGYVYRWPSICSRFCRAWQVRQAMEKDKISKVEMARRMNTSRAALDRLLDPDNASVTLQTLSRAAHAIGRDLRIELV